MRIVADLHIHSKYSRAVSPEMLPETLDAWADDKGITVMGTGDFTHPLWLAELQKKLAPAEPGLFALKKQFKQKTLKGTFATATRFLLTVEISCIYSRAGRTRRVHHLIFAPDFATVEKINTALGRIGNLKSDGRPIIGIDSEDLLKIVLECSPSTRPSSKTSAGAASSGHNGAVLVPAHIWTPWFSVFGSMSGFDSLDECFGDYAKHIFAVETGLSSDPPMNWRMSALDHVALISNSDSHSLQRIGREANIFDTELSYDGIVEAMKSGRPLSPRHPDPATAGEGSRARREILRRPLAAQNDIGGKFLGTIEFFPEEGRYHYDGHRLCGIMWTPEETKKHSGICPKCGQKVTVGVLNRVAGLADRKEGYRDARRPPYWNLVPLDEIIGEALDVGPKSKAVQKEYQKLIVAFGSELAASLDVSIPKLATVAMPEVAEGIERMRSGKVSITPGYDGEYGIVKMFSAKDRKRHEQQSKLF
ncbi:MAG: DNA helicase UvrD [Candidatus Harrisonbacteria bacterium]|nr:DNA helicase UvrD [Candidatus Harrisonbacteria bacterium]